MGTPKTNKWLKRLKRWKTSQSPWKAYLLLFLMLVSIVSSVRAGDLKNNGAINNSGTIKVKNQAIGLPMINNGVYEFFGGNQTIPGRQFQDLSLTGSGTKSTSGTDVTVYGTLAIALGITLATTAGADVHLNGTGTLNEQGYLLGVVDKTVTLAGASGSSNFGNIGATISWTGLAPGNTTVVRTTGVASTSVDPLFAGKQSIKRYFDIAPTFSSGLNGILEFKYADIELNGQDENTFSLWRSVDGGLNWRKQGGAVNASLNTVTKSGILNFSRWTVSDAANPLGPSFIEGAAQNLTLVSGNGQSAAPSSVLPAPFVAAVRDYYGNPIPGIPVTFAITGTPGGATGQNLSVTNATTDVNGRATTVLTLGNTAGAYSVAATAAGLAGSPIAFTATATGSPPPPPPPPPAATSIVMTAGQGQTDTVSTQLDNPFVVTVLSQSGTPFAGTAVRFAIAVTPAGASGTVLSDTLVTTNAAGQAFTKLTLGNKVGTYTVTVSSGSLIGSPITFTATAVAGRPVYLSATSGNNQTAPVRTTLPQAFVVTVTDTFGNAKQGVTVRFAMASMPVGAQGQTLSDTSVITGANGQASTRLTLGDSVGVYGVTASSGSLLGSPAAFSATAIASTAAASMVLTFGDGQRGRVNTTLTDPLVVTVINASGNPVAGVPVTFAIVDTPAGAAGQRLTALQALTDSLGHATTSLTLGSRPGVYRIAATSAGLAGSPIMFTATAEVGAAASLVFVSGYNQIGVAGTTLAQLFVVTVLDGAGNAVPGATVIFAVDSIPLGASGQFFNGASSVAVTTNSLGVASVSFTLGDRAGIYRVTAVSSGLSGSPIVFRATATIAGGAVSIVYTAGDWQSAPILTDLVHPLIVTVLSASGSPIAGQPVTFALDSIPAGAIGQTVTPITVITDVLGQASTIVKLGSKVGVYKITASSGGLAGSPIEFQVSATVGAPRTLAYITGDNQIQPITSTLNSAFVVRVLDVGENPVPGVAVQFTLDSIPTGATGQSLRVINSLTDADGRASALLALGNRVGIYVASAMSGGLAGSPIRFSARATTGAPVAMFMTSGNEQTGFVSTELPAPFIVNILDISGNPVPGVAVQFALDSVPSGARGQSLRIINSATNELGQASVVLMLGDKVGRYTVTASSSGLLGSPTRFAATASILVGDVNSDREINIADLTSVIDHILGKFTLTGNDSAKADMNKDGRISVADVVAMQNLLLGVPQSGLSSSDEPDRALASLLNLLQSTADSTLTVKGEFVLTDNGVRFSMMNLIPVKGVQLVVRFRSATTIQRPDVIFPRAAVDSFYVGSSGRELRLLAYNPANIPIAAGEGPLFRLPIKLASLDEIEAIQFIVSARDSTLPFDKALKASVEKRLPTPQEIPFAFILYQNYPNPFNSMTRIDYEVADLQGRAADVLVQVYNLLGEKVKALASGRHASGRYSVTWDGTDSRGQKVPSGTYYYRLISGDHASGKKMILLK